jgi:class 3 adenylate cyclase
MANLDQIKYFNERFNKPSSLTRKQVLFSINESLNPSNIKKAISNSLASLGVDFTKYLDNGVNVDATLLFIDISDFSTKQSTLNGDQISDFFDEYYDIVIPIIYKYGGEIDKVMGDGIVCVFAPPFLIISPGERRRNANSCAEEIVKVTKGSKFSSKAAIHSGDIKYYKNKSGYYQEYTIVGKPLTELFRLESVSNDNCINFYADSPIHDLHKSAIEKNNMLSIMYTMPYGPYSRHNVVELKGVSYSSYYSKKI